MFADRSIQACVCESQSLDWSSADNVGLNDFVHIGFAHVPVPDRFRIDHDVRSVLALVEASGLVRPHSPLQSAFGEFLLEELLQPGFGGGIAAASRMACRSLVATDENVVLELGHCINISSARAAASSRRTAFLPAGRGILLQRHSPFLDGSSCNEIFRYA